MAVAGKEIERPMAFAVGVAGSEPDVIGDEVFGLFYGFL